MSEIQSKPPSVVERYPSSILDQLQYQQQSSTAAPAVAVAPAATAAPATGPQPLNTSGPLGTNTNLIA